MLEEVDDLGERLFGLVLAGNVVERGLVVLVRHDLGTGFGGPADAAETAAAEVHRGTVVAHLLAELPIEQPAAEEDEEYGDTVRDQHIEPQLRALVLHLGRELHVVLLEAFYQRVVVGPAGGLVGHALLIGRVGNGAVGLVERDRLDLAVVHLCEKLAVCDGLNLRGGHIGKQCPLQAEGNGDSDDHIQDHRLPLALVVHFHGNILSPTGSVR